MPEPIDPEDIHGPDGIRPSFRRHQAALDNHPDYQDIFAEERKFRAGRDAEKTMTMRERIDSRRAERGQGPLYAGYQPGQALSNFDEGGKFTPPPRQPDVVPDNHAPNAAGAGRFATARAPLLTPENQAARPMREKLGDALTNVDNHFADNGTLPERYAGKVLTAIPRAALGIYDGISERRPLKVFGSIAEGALDLSPAAGKVAGPLTALTSSIPRAIGTNLVARAPSAQDEAAERLKSQVLGSSASSDGRSTQRDPRQDPEYQGLKDHFTKQIPVDQESARRRKAAEDAMSFATSPNSFPGRDTSRRANATTAAQKALDDAEEYRKGVQGPAMADADARAEAVLKGRYDASDAADKSIQNQRLPVRDRLQLAIDRNGIPVSVGSLPMVAGAAAATIPGFRTILGGLRNGANARAGAEAASTMTGKARAQQLAEAEVLATPKPFTKADLWDSSAKYGTAAGFTTGLAFNGIDAEGLSPINPKKTAQSEYVRKLLESDPTRGREEAKLAAMPDSNPQRDIALSPGNAAANAFVGALEGWGGGKMAGLAAKGIANPSGATLDRIKAMRAGDTAGNAYKADKGIEDIGNAARLRSAQADDLTRGSADLRQGLMAAEGNANAAIGSQGRVSDALAANERKMRGIGRDKEINKINDARQIEAERAQQGLPTATGAQSGPLPPGTTPPTQNPGPGDGPVRPPKPIVSGPGDKSVIVRPNPEPGPKPTPEPIPGSGRSNRRYGLKQQDLLQPEIGRLAEAGPHIPTVEAALNLLRLKGVPESRMPLGTGIDDLKQRLLNAQVRLNDLRRGDEGFNSEAGKALSAMMQTAKKAKHTGRDAILPALLAAGVTPAVLRNRDNAFAED
jgi:hypothetical protein